MHYAHNTLRYIEHKAQCDAFHYNYELVLESKWLVPIYEPRHKCDAFQRNCKIVFKIKQSIMNFKQKNSR